MSSVAVVVVFSLTWWMVFFMLLPIGATPPEHPEKGHSAGAPARHGLRWKLLATTCIAVPLTAGILWLISLGLIPLRGVTP